MRATQSPWSFYLPETKMLGVTKRRQPKEQPAHRHTPVCRACRGHLSIRLALGGCANRPFLPHCGCSQVLQEWSFHGALRLLGSYPAVTEKTLLPGSGIGLAVGLTSAYGETLVFPGFPVSDDDHPCSLWRSKAS